MAPASGTVYAINVSNGGVPKTPTASARVTRRGISGDRQRDLRYHGGPDRAICLYSFDLIERLQHEGHPIAPGTIGENLTLAGIDWSAVSTGALVTIGSVQLEVTSPASPCKTIARSFADGEFVRVSQRLRPGWSRWYCRVLDEGEVCVGDAALCIRTGGDL